MINWKSLQLLCPYEWMSSDCLREVQRSFYLEGASNCREARGHVWGSLCCETCSDPASKSVQGSPLPPGVGHRILNTLCMNSCKSNCKQQSILYPFTFPDFTSESVVENTLSIYETIITWKIPNGYFKTHVPSRALSPVDYMGLTVIQL